MPTLIAQVKLQQGLLQRKLETYTITFSWMRMSFKALRPYHVSHLADSMIPKVRKYRPKLIDLQETAGKGEACRQLES